MKTYTIHIELSNGNEVNANAVAENEEKAIQRVKDNEQFKQFVGDATIVTMTATPIEEELADTNRFDVNIDGNDIIAVDLDNRIQVSFKRGRFNETQVVKPFGDKNLSALELAKGLRELTDWLQTEHKELV